MNTIPPDEHLRQALRHAPDAHLSAPSELSAQILAAAQRSTAAGPAAPSRARRDGRGWLAGLWHRPGASAALASVLLAGFVGLLWRGEVPGPAGEGAPAFEPPAAVALPAVADTASGPSAVALAAKPKQPAAADQAPSRVNAVLPQEATTSQQAASAARRAVGNSLPDPAAVLRTQPARLAPVQPDPVPTAESTVQATAQATARADQAVASPTLGAAAVPTTTADAAPAPPPIVISGAPAGRAQPAAAGVAAAGEAPAVLRKAETRLAAAGPRPALPGTWAAGGGAQWRWQPEGTMREPDATWWATLAGATQGRWQAAAEAQPLPGSLQLQGQRESEALGRLWLEPAGVLWCSPVPPCQRAPLPADSRRDLLERLAR